MANLRRPKGKRKYTHTGVRINYYGENRVVFLHKTPKQWQDPSVHGLMHKENKWDFMDTLQPVN